MKRTISFTLRMPEDLHAQLERASKDRSYSMNALALDAIRCSLQPPAKTTVADDVRQMLQANFTELEKRLTRLYWNARDGVVTVNPETGKLDPVEVCATKLDPEQIRPVLSPTGRLSARSFVPGGYTGDPLPALSGLDTLTTLKMGTMRDRVDAEVANLGAFKQLSGRIARQPLKGQVWVITGSLETMTRDRAREILMELGATVAGSVCAETSGLVFGPGSGSKLKRAVDLGVRRWNERQFIHMIQGMGVDMPLPKPAEQHLVTPGALEWDAPAIAATWLEWTDNTGSQPPVTKGKLVDLMLYNGSVVKKIPADDCDWSLDTAESSFDIIRWRLSSIELQPQVQPCEPGTPWTENEGWRPNFLRPDQMIETETRGSGVHRRLVGDIPGSWWLSVGEAGPHIKRWRFAK